MEQLTQKNNDKIDEINQKAIDKSHKEDLEAEKQDLEAIKRKSDAKKKAIEDDEKALKALLDKAAKDADAKSGGSGKGSELISKINEYNAEIAVYKDHIQNIGALDEKEAADYIDLQAKKKQAVTDLANYAIQTAEKEEGDIMKLVQMSFENQEKSANNYYKKEDDALKKQYANHLITHAQLDAKEAALNEQKVAKENELKHKQDVANKDSAIFKATMALATAVIEATTAGPGIGLVLAGITAAFDAVYLGMAISAQLPQYALGRTGGKGEMAIVGERGSELIRTGNESYLTPDKPTLTYIPSGADIIPNDKLVQMEMDNRSTGERMSESIGLNIVANKLDNVEAAIKNKKEVSFIGTERGIRAVVRNGNSLTEYLNKNIIL